MKKISVVTGATGGMGFYTAKIAGEKTTVLFTGRSTEKVEATAEKLRAAGVDCEGMVCDVTDREQVKALAERANEMGKIVAVYSVAGLSPSNGHSGEAIMRANAFSVVYTNEEFSKYMTDGCFMNVSSSTAYMLPEDRLPKQLFDLALTNIPAFEAGMMQMTEAAGMAYAISKSFVKYYTGKSAYVRGRGQNNRVVSVAPGVIDTKMTQNEASERAKAASLTYCSLNRIGTPEELAFSFVALADERNSFVTGVDLLVDGGCMCEGYDGVNPRGAEDKVSAVDAANAK